MREILYRGKRVDTGEWVDGFYLVLPMGEIVILSNKGYTKVTPETVGQYTGFKDKNEKKIFEGDIVVDGRGHYGKVFFEKGCFLIEWTIKDYIKGKSVDDSFGCAEVVSNIYDHPELLEAK